MSRFFMIGASFVKRLVIITVTFVRNLLITWVILIAGLVLLVYLSQLDLKLSLKPYEHRRLYDYFNEQFDKEVAEIGGPHIVLGRLQNMRFVIFNEVELSKNSPIKACVVDRKIDWDCVGARPDTSAIVTASEFNWR